MRDGFGKTERIKDINVHEFEKKTHNKPTNAYIFLMNMLIGNILLNNKGAGVNLQTV